MTRIKNMLILIFGMSVFFGSMAGATEYPILGPCDSKVSDESRKLYFAGLHSWKLNEKYGDYQDKKGNERNAYDIFYHPKGPKTPLLIYIHGGGFVGGDKCKLYQSSAVPAKELLNSRMAIATISYRLLEKQGENIGVLKPLMDSRKALQTIRSRAKKYNIDPRQVILMGGSAGAGTSLWIGLQDERAQPDNPNRVLRQSTRVQGVIAMETQATYNLVKWHSQVFAYEGGGSYFKDYTLQESELGRFDLYKQSLFQFYGVDRWKDLQTDRHKRYRKRVDMLRMMDKSDPPLFIQNVNQPDVMDPISRSLINHHKNHALMLEEVANQQGIKNITIAGQGSADPEVLYQARWNFIRSIFNK